MSRLSSQSRRPAVAPALLLLAALAPTAGAQRAAPEQVPGDLALGLVDLGYVAVPDSTLAVVGRVPDGFPAARALPARGRVLGGARWPSGSTAVVVAVDQAPAAARAEVLAALEAAGWRPPPARPGADDRFPQFLNTTPPDREREGTRCAPDTTASVLVSARPRADGTGALVRVLAYPRARSARCRPAPVRVEGPRFPMPPALRPLEPPPGVRVSVGVPDFTPGPFTARATATGSAADPARLRAHYAAELAAAGWTRAVVPGWDTTRATPLYVSPPDSTGGRWAASLTAEPDTASRDTVRRVTLALALAPVRPGRATSSAPWLMGFTPAQGSVSWSTVVVGQPAGTTPGGSSGVAAGGRGTTARRATAGPPVPRELVDALLADGLFGTGAERGGPTLSVGAVPAGWPAPTPAGPGVRVLGGTTQGLGSDADPSFAGGMLVVFAPGTPGAARDAYVRQLDAAGWRRPAPDDSGTTGFLTNPGERGALAASATRCSPARDMLLTAEAVPRAAGGTVLRLTALGGDAFSGVCAPSDPAGRVRGVSVGELRAPVPPLAVPPGLTVTEGRGGGGGGQWELSAVVRGAASPEAVVAAYAPQLRAAGWSVGAPAAGPDLAAVRLTRAARPGTDDQGAWTGLLSAVWRPGGVYAVSLAVRRDDAGR